MAFEVARDGRKTRVSPDPAATVIVPRLQPFHAQPNAWAHREVIHLLHEDNPDKLLFSGQMLHKQRFIGLISHQPSPKVCARIVSTMMWDANGLRAVIERVSKG